MSEPIYDRFDKEIKAGDVLDVQRAGHHVVYEEDGDLWFTPYGKPDRVRDYFRNDIVLVDENAPDLATRITSTIRSLRANFPPPSFEGQS
jgi:hypothetical protein